MTARFTTLSLCLFTISLTQAAGYAAMTNPRVIAIFREHGSNLPQESLPDLLRQVGAKKDDRDLAASQLAELITTVKGASTSFKRFKQAQTGTVQRSKDVAKKMRRKHSNRP